MEKNTIDNIKNWYLGDVLLEIEPLSVSEIKEKLETDSGVIWETKDIKRIIKGENLDEKRGLLNPDVIQAIHVLYLHRTATGIRTFSNLQIVDAINKDFGLNLRAEEVNDMENKYKWKEGFNEILRKYSKLPQTIPVLNANPFYNANSLKEVGKVLKIKKMALDLANRSYREIIKCMEEGVYNATEVLKIFFMSTEILKNLDSDLGNPRIRPSKNKSIQVFRINGKDIEI